MNNLTNLLPPAEFDRFYKEITDALLDARSNPGTKNLSIRMLMDKYGIELPQNTENLFNDTSQVLDANLYDVSKASSDKCPACALCTLCIFCGELNAGAGLISLVGLASLSSSLETASLR
jgi:hypothetical protein